MKQVIEDYCNGFISSLDLVCAYERMLKPLKCEKPLEDAINKCLEPLTFFIIDLFGEEWKVSDLSQFDFEEQTVISDLKKKIEEQEYTIKMLKNVIKDIEGCASSVDSDTYYRIDQNGDAHPVRKRGGFRSEK